MSWERQLSTPGTGKEDLVGSTYRFYSEKSQLEVVGEHDFASSRLRLSMRAGEYVHQSTWLDTSPLLDRVGTDQLLQEALERFLLLATLPSTGRESTLTPLELTILLYQTCDHVLA